MTTTTPRRRLSTSHLAPMEVRRAGITNQKDKDEVRTQAQAALAKMKALEAKLIKKRKLHKTIIGDSEIRGTGELYHDTVTHLKNR